jgi:hypothetical protein
MCPALPVSNKIYSEPGLELELEPEPKEIFAVPRSRSRKKYFLPHNTCGILKGTKRENEP